MTMGTAPIKVIHSFIICIWCAYNFTKYMYMNVSTSKTIHNQTLQSFFPASYTLHNQTLQSVSRAKYPGAEFVTENLHWRKPLQSTTAKANKVSAFAYINLKGCPPLSRCTVLQRQTCLPPDFSGRFSRFHGLFSGLPL